ncbi:MAG TPA: hypothetical protein VII82_05740, partial [Polyangiaceae bacterium]
MNADRVWRRVLAVVRASGAAVAPAAKGAAKGVAAALARPPLTGAIYVTLLALWAARTPPEDPQQLGAQAHQIEAVVEGRFGGEIGRIAVALVAAAIAYGLVLGFLADGLVALREWLHPAYPMRMRRWLRVLLGVVALHAFVELWAMASDPP